MSVLKWSPEKRVTVELRKSLNGARKAGAATDFAALSPSVLPDELDIAPGESVCAEVKNLHGRRFYFTDLSLYLEREGSFVRLPYESIASYHWIDDAPDFKMTPQKKREHGDRLLLHDDDGARYELDALGWAFQGMHNFFGWLVRRRETAV
jgi:hypothetical protein